MPDINNATFALSFRRPNCGSFLVYQVTQGFHYKSSGLSYPNGWSVHTQFLFITSIGSLAIKSHGMPEGVDVACFCASQELLMQDSQVSILSKNDQYLNNDIPFFKVSLKYWNVVRFTQTKQFIHKQADFTEESIID